MINIVLDGMGGDNAPESTVLGAVKAVNEFNDIKVTITGVKDKLNDLLSVQNYDPEQIVVIDAPDTITMEDTPTAAIKEKKDSSMVVGLNMVAQGEGDIFVSGGNTGALLAGATLIIRRAKGIKRSPLASQIPSASGSVLLLDLGANVDCKPEYLKQFAVLGSIFMEKVADVKDPRVGLLNNGAEEHKGNMLTKESYQLLKECESINFAGNAEASQIMSGDFDVVVADGFVGNVVLKLLEGTAKTVFNGLKDSIGSSFKGKMGALMLKDSLRGLKKSFDYKEYGGALMLGLNRGVIKAHGSSDDRAIYNALALARKFVNADVVNVINSALKDNNGDE